MMAGNGLPAAPMPKIYPLLYFFQANETVREHGVFDDTPINQGA